MKILIKGVWQPDWRLGFVCRATSHWTTNFWNHILWVNETTVDILSIFHSLGNNLHINTNTSHQLYGTMVEMIVVCSAATGSSVLKDTEWLKYSAVMLKLDWKRLIQAMDEYWFTWRNYVPQQCVRHSRIQLLQVIIAAPNCTSRLLECRLFFTICSHFGFVTIK